MGDGDNSPHPTRSSAKKEPKTEEKPQSARKEKESGEEKGFDLPSLKKYLKAKLPGVTVEDEAAVAIAKATELFLNELTARTWQAGDKREAAAAGSSKKRKALGIVYMDVYDATQAWQPCGILASTVPRPISGAEYLEMQAKKAKTGGSSAADETGS